MMKTARLSDERMGDILAGKMARPRYFDLARRAARGIKVTVNPGETVVYDLDAAAR